MRRSNFGKSPDEIREIIAAHESRVDARHENARRIGDDDACHLGLSAWGEGLTATLLERELELSERGWTASFPRLADLEGNEIPARVIDSRFGRCWMLLDEKGESTGTFAPYRPKRPSTLERRGYREIEVERPAFARLEGDGRGLSGRVWVEIVERELEESTR